MKISFIAPAYKVEKYLQDFFDGFKKLENNFEIILVNDNPTSDLSSWENALENVEIKVINNEQNLGSKKSRFAGLKSISSETTHVIFIDPDDKLSDDCKFIDLGDLPTQYSYNEWYVNKKNPQLKCGSISKYNIDNHLWGVVFPREIAMQIPRYSHDMEIDDMPIKWRMAEKYEFIKTEKIMIDYRMRKGSLANSKKSREGAIEQVNTWDNLYKIDKLIDYSKSVNNQYFELIINKKSFDPIWFKNKHNELRSQVSFITKFNSHMYRAVSWWALQNKLKSIFLNRKMFD